MPMSYKISNKFLDAEQIIFSWSIYLNIRPIKFKTYHTEKLQEKRKKNKIVLILMKIMTKDTHNNSWSFLFCI